jgi:S-adenosylmethionine hydrolase
MAMITLLTDFGQKDAYVGVMKGVILGIAPNVQLVDLSHEIEPQNILAGMVLLGRSVPYFPPGTIHLAVIDPGVGTDRRPIAARLGEQFYVGPDNGLMTQVYKEAKEKARTIEIVHLNQTKYWRKEISHSFHGRDIFAPVAAHLANGVTLKKMGALIDDPVLLRIPMPERTGQGWRGEILHIDSFGNVATNFSLKDFGSASIIQVNLKGRKINTLVKTFGEGRPGESIALFDSAGYLAIAVVNGNAAKELHVKVGDLLEVVTN